MRNISLYHLFKHNAQVRSDKPAIITKTQQTSFKSLLEGADMAAEKLVKRGVSRGDRVAVLSMNHPLFFQLIGGVSKVGATIVLLNWRLSDGELDYILKDSGTTLLFTDDTFTERARGLGLVRTVQVVHLDDLVAKRLHAAPAFKHEQSIGEDPFCIIYTAAVDGYPKGAVLSHNNLLSANLQVICSMGLSEADVHLTMLPLFHITGLNMALATMQAGGRNVVVEKFAEQEVLEMTRQEGVTLWGSFPPILQRMVQAIKAAPDSVSSLKYVVGLDGPENIESIEKLCSARFWILYGQSETSGFVTFSQASERLGSAGQAGPLSRFRLVNDAGQEVAAGEIGEIVVQGPLVFQGYWQLPEVTAHTFRDGWHHTGDLGSLDKDGYLYFKGRKPEKELIKPGGENVYPAEVEAVILQHSEVMAACVIGVPDSKFGEGVKAVCVRIEKSTLTVAELIEFVGGRIARYKKPGYVQFVDELPMKGNEIDRLSVKELYGGEQ